MKQIGGGAVSLSVAGVLWLQVEWQSTVLVWCDPSIYASMARHVTVTCFILRGT